MGRPADSSPRSRDYVAIENWRKGMSGVAKSLTPMRATDFYPKPGPASPIYSTMLHASIAATICAAPGFACWRFANTSPAKFLSQYDGDVETAEKVLLFVLLSTILFSTLYLIPLWKRKAKTWLQVFLSLQETNRMLCFFLTFPILAFLTEKGVEIDAPFFVHFLFGLALLFGSITCLQVSTFAGLWSRFERFFHSGSRGISLLLVLGAATAYSVFISHASLVNYQAFNNCASDLAVYNNVLWRTSHGDLLGTSLLPRESHLVTHCDPILIFLAPLYRIWPSAEWLLIFQTIWLASGVLPILFLTEHELQDSRLGCALAFSYLLHPGLHGANMFEFHSLTLIIPMLLWLWYFFVTARFALSLSCVIFILMTREDMALLLLPVAMVQTMLGKARPFGISTGMLSLGYLALSKFFLMPDSGLFMNGPGLNNFADRFKQLMPHEQGVFELLLTISANPLYTLSVICEQKKILYLLQMSTPVLFLPFFSGIRVGCFLYGALFILCASYAHHYSLYAHYTALVIPFLFALSPSGILSVSRKLHSALGLSAAGWARFLVLFVLFASLLESWKYGAYVRNDAFRIVDVRSVHFSDDIAIQKAKQNSAELDSFIASIPPESVLSASHFILPHLSNRQEILRYPNRTSTSLMLLGLPWLSKEERIAYEEDRASGGVQEVKQSKNFVLLQPARREVR